MSWQQREKPLVFDRCDEDVGLHATISEHPSSTAEQEHWMWEVWTTGWDNFRIRVYGEMPKMREAKAQAEMMMEGLKRMLEKM